MANTSTICQQAAHTFCHLLLLTIQQEPDKVYVLEIIIYLFLNVRRMEFWNKNDC